MTSTLVPLPVHLIPSRPLRARFYAPATSCDRREREDVLGNDLLRVTQAALPGARSEQGGRTTEGTSSTSPPFLVCSFVALPLSGMLNYFVSFPVRLSTPLVQCSLFLPSATLVSPSATHRRCILRCLLFHRLLANLCLFARSSLASLRSTSTCLSLETGLQRLACSTGVRPSSLRRPRFETLRRSPASIT
jgi:hypothetical protein